MSFLVSACPISFLVSAWPISFLVDGLVVVVSRFAGTMVNAETMPVVKINAAAMMVFFMFICC